MGAKEQMGENKLLVSQVLSETGTRAPRTRCRINVGKTSSPLLSTPTKNEYCISKIATSKKQPQLSINDLQNWTIQTSSHRGRYQSSKVGAGHMLIPGPYHVQTSWALQDKHQYPPIYWTIWTWFKECRFWSASIKRLEVKGSHQVYTCTEMLNFKRKQ